MPSGYFPCNIRCIDENQIHDRLHLLVSGVLVRLTLFLGAHMRHFSLAIGLSFFFLFSDLAAADTFRVATWNIKWCFDHRTGDNSSRIAREQSAPSRAQWRWRVEQLADAILEIGPDVLALQEIEDGDAVLEIADELNDRGADYEVSFVQGLDSHTEQDVAFLVREGLAFEGQRFAFTHRGDSDFKNLSKHQLLSVNVNGIPVSIINVHLITRSVQRMRQARTLRDWIDSLDQNSHLIVIGDTNVSLDYEDTRPNSDIGTIRGLATTTPADDLFDLHEHLSVGDRATFHSGRHLDRILISRHFSRPGGLIFGTIVNRRDVAVRGDFVDRASWSTDNDERDLSDHYPLVATFTIEGSAPREHLALMTGPAPEPPSSNEASATEERSLLANSRPLANLEPVADRGGGFTPIDSDEETTSDEPTIFCLQAYPDRMQARLETRDRLLRRALPDEVGTLGRESVVQLSKRWLPGQTVTVAFRGGTYQLRKRIADTARQWEQHGNLRFDFGHDPENATFRNWTPNDVDYAADIRIGFNLRGYWSLVGTDCVNPMIVGPGQASMNLANFHLNPPAGWKGTVLHEFGHALGFHHEHQHPENGCDEEFRWEDDPGYIPTTDHLGQFIVDDQGRRPGIYTVLAGRPNEWPKWRVDHNLRQLDDSDDLRTGPFDSESIMLYAFENWMFKNGDTSRCHTGVRAQSLSEGDGLAMADAYPDNRSSIEAVVEQRNDLASEITTIQQEVAPPTLRSDLRHVYANLATNPFTFWTTEQVQETRPVEYTVSKAVPEERTSTYTVMVPTTEVVERVIEETINGQTVKRTVQEEVTKMVPEQRTRTYTVTKQVPETRTREITVTINRPVQKSFDIRALATELLAEDASMPRDDLVSEILKRTDKEEDPQARRFAENELTWLLEQEAVTDSLQFRGDVDYVPAKALPVEMPTSGSGVDLTDPLGATGMQDAADSLGRPAGFGHFEGRVLVHWDPDGRNMILEEEFRYVDRNGRTWVAPAGSVINGASIPRVFWTVIGGPFEGKYRDASVVHDVHCEQREASWRDVHRMFYEACRCGGVGRSKAKLLYFAVYQFGPRWDTQSSPLMAATSTDALDRDTVRALWSYIDDQDPTLEELEDLAPAEAAALVEPRED